MKLISGRQGLRFFLLYALIIGLVFLQWPLYGSLPGDLDTWANLAMFKNMQLQLQHLFGGPVAGAANYPAQHVWALYGLDFFSGIIFLFYAALGFSDLWAYYLYIVTLYALNSYAVFKLCRLYSASGAGVFFAGLFFSLSNFMLGNVDGPNVAFCFPGFMAMYFLLTSISRSTSDRFAASVFFMGLCLLLSPVNAVVFAGLWLLVVVFRFKQAMQMALNLKWFLPASVFVVLVAAPFIYYYKILKLGAVNYNQLNNLSYAPFLSLNLDSFWQTLPHNLIFKGTDTSWPRMVRSAYPALSIALVAVLGLFAGKRKLFPLLLLFGGALIALGPYICLHNNIVCPSPMLLLYRLLPFSTYVRVPLRLYFIALCGLMILFSMGWQILENLKLPAKALLLLVVFMAFVESVPFPLVNYSSVGKLNQAFNNAQLLPRDGAVVLNLPSSLFVQQDQREYIYMYYQTFHHHNILNGSLAYFPPERLRADSLCKQLNSNSAALDSLIDEYHVGVIMFHKDFALASESAEEDILMQSPRLYLSKNTNNKMVFLVKQ